MYATFYRTEDALPCVAGLVKLGVTVTMYLNDRGRTNIDFPAMGVSTGRTAESMVQPYVDSDKAYWRGPQGEAEDDDHYRRLEHEREQGGLEYDGTLGV